MKYNDILSVLDVTDESGDYEEPVSIDEMKDYLRLEGYVDDDESTSDDLSDFDFDDRLIADLIRSSREVMEKMSHSTIVPKVYEVVLTNLCGMIELPNGPIGEIISLYDDNGDEVASDNYVIIGNNRKFLKSPCQSNIVITYEGNPDRIIPRGLKVDIMRLTAYMYENRGDEEVQKFAAQLALKYNREGWIV